MEILRSVKDVLKLQFKHERELLWLYYLLRALAVLDCEAIAL